LTTSLIYVNDETYGQTFVTRQQYLLPSCAIVADAADVLRLTLYPKQADKTRESINILMSSGERWIIIQNRYKENVSADSWNILKCIV